MPPPTHSLSTITAGSQNSAPPPLQRSTTKMLTIFNELIFFATFTLKIRFSPLTPVDNLQTCSTSSRQSSTPPSSFRAHRSGFIGFILQPSHFSLFPTQSSALHSKHTRAQSTPTVWQTHCAFVYPKNRISHSKTPSNTPGSTPSITPQNKARNSSYQSSRLITLSLIPQKNLISHAKNPHSPTPNSYKRSDKQSALTHCATLPFFLHSPTPSPTPPLPSPSPFPLPPSPFPLPPFPPSAFRIPHFPRRSLFHLWPFIPRARTTHQTPPAQNPRFQNPQPPPPPHHIPPRLRPLPCAQTRRSSLYRKRRQRLFTPEVPPHANQVSSFKYRASSSASRIPHSAFRISAAPLFFIIPHSSFLVPHSSFLIPRTSFLVPHSSFLVPRSSCSIPPSPSTPQMPPPITTTKTTPITTTKTTPNSTANRFSIDLSIYEHYYIEFPSPIPPLPPIFPILSPHTPTRAIHRREIQRKGNCRKNAQHLQQVERSSPLLRQYRGFCLRPN